MRYDATYAEAPSAVVKMEGRLRDEKKPNAIKFVCGNFHAPAETQGALKSCRKPSALKFLCNKNHEPFGTTGWTPGIPLRSARKPSALKFVCSQLYAPVSVVQPGVSSPPTALKFITKLCSVVGLVEGHQNRDRPETEPKPEPGPEPKPVRPQSEATEGAALLYPNCDLTIWLRTCEEEVITPLDGVTTGTIPVWINGTLYRNGPGKLHYQKQSVNHLFDAAGLLHG